MIFRNLFICPKITKICEVSLSIISWLHKKFGGIWIKFEENTNIPLISN